MGLISPEWNRRVLGVWFSHVRGKKIVHIVALESRAEQPEPQVSLPSSSDFVVQTGQYLAHAYCRSCPHGMIDHVSNQAQSDLNAGGAGPTR